MEKIMKNYMYTLLSALFIAAPMLAMEKRKRDSELAKDTSKKAHTQVVTARPSYLENLPSELKNMVFEYVHANNSLARAIAKASESGDAQNIHFILTHFPHTNLNNKVKPEDSTALIRATRSSHTDVAELLIKAGADVFATNINTETALWHAATRGDVDIARMLLAKAPPVTSAPGTPTLHTLLNIADFAQCHKPLARAIVYEHVPMVQLLLEYGANPNNTTIGLGIAVFHNITGLLHAAQIGNFAIVDLLLMAGAKANDPSMGYTTQDNDYVKKPDMTALMLAAQNGHKAVVQRLVQEPNIAYDACNIEGKTALDLAQESTSENKKEIIMLLKQHMQKKK